MVFGGVIIQIGSSGSTIVTELILIIPSADPVEAHFHDVGSFEDYGIFCYCQYGGKPLCYNRDDSIEFFLHIDKIT